MQPTVDYGIDYADATFAEVSDVSNYLNDIYRALSTPPENVQVVDGVLSPLIFWDPLNLSFDLRAYCNDSVSQADIAALPGRIERIFEDDDRFAAMSATATYANLTLTIVVSATAATGLSFAMTLVADSNQILVTSTQTS